MLNLLLHQTWCEVAPAHKDPKKSWITDEIWETVNKVAEVRNPMHQMNRKAALARKA